MHRRGRPNASHARGLATFPVTERTATAANAEGEPGGSETLVAAPGPAATCSWLGAGRCANPKLRMGPLACHAAAPCAGAATR
eukprot:14819623-Alexandrium_andersonii.AAC.1